MSNSTKAAAPNRDNLDRLIDMLVSTVRQRGVSIEDREQLEIDLTAALRRSGLVLAASLPPDWPADFILPSADADEVLRFSRLEPETGAAVRAAFDAFDRLITPAMLVDGDVAKARAALGSAVGSTLGRFARLCAHARMVAEERAAERSALPPDSERELMRCLHDFYAARKGMEGNYRDDGKIISQRWLEHLNASDRLADAIAAALREPRQQEKDFSAVTRFEVVDQRKDANPMGRVFTAWDATVSLRLQDGGRTLKAFVDGEAPVPAGEPRQTASDDDWNEAILASKRGVAPAPAALPQNLEQVLAEHRIISGVEIGTVFCSCSSSVVYESLEAHEAHVAGVLRAAAQREEGGK